MPDPRKLVTPMIEGLLKPLRRLDETFQPIKTYHASPYDFDVVDLSKVGSGQGAQMYGHGFYSAQSPEVSGPGGAYWHEFYDKRFGDFIPHNETFARDIEQIATDVLKRHKFDRASAAAQMRKDADAFAAVQPDHPKIDVYRRGADMLESGAQVGPRVYETHLYARPEDFLDWDQRLGAQSQQVQSALENIGWKVGSRTGTGESIYKELTAAAGGGRPGQKVATESLADVGIPGIRYLDQKSRHLWSAPRRLREIESDLDRWQGNLMNPAYGPREAEHFQQQIAALEKERDSLIDGLSKATYNYVTGNTDIIDLAKKFALPGVLSAGALPYLSNAPVQTRY